MADTPLTTKKSISPDWLVQGVLTKVGDIFDRLTGRRWKPGSALATSELIERLKFLLDSEAADNGGYGKYVPHNIKLKMQWDKFSTDSEQSLRLLENELLTAAIDHINDRRYYTYAPLQIEVRPDYFTQGVKLFASFEKFSDEEQHEAELNVPVPGSQPVQPAPLQPAAVNSETIVFSFVVGAKQTVREIVLEEGNRLSIGRTKENDLAIEDASVSKFHASINLNTDGRLLVADTGSTNGTFVNGQRIAYGKAVEINLGDKLNFGVVPVAFELKPKLAIVPPLTDTKNDDEIPDTESFTVGEFEFIKRIEPAKTQPAVETPRSGQLEAPAVPAPTMPAIDIHRSDVKPQPDLDDA
jgi:pSer/pThr/pTyr-binding forkhead associated (FHA) protein